MFVWGKYDWMSWRLGMEGQFSEVHRIVCKQGSIVLVSSSVLIYGGVSTMVQWRLSDLRSLGKDRAYSPRWDGCPAEVEERPQAQNLWEVSQFLHILLILFVLLIRSPNMQDWDSLTPNMQGVTVKRINNCQNFQKKNGGGGDDISNALLMKHNGNSNHIWDEARSF